MNNYSAQSALDYIDNNLLKTLGIRRRHEVGRTKGQIFEMADSSKQFALMLGDKDAKSGKFLRQEVRVVVEDDIPEGLPDVNVLPVSDQLASSVLNDTGWSRLKVPNQRSAIVTSDLGLRKVLEWYAGRISTPMAQHPTEQKRDASVMTAIASPLSAPATNTIFFGPPGTGKTYSTTSYAVQLCDGELPQSGGKEAIRTRFEELRREGRISFVTFHQSYGYEEFVEGLRPQATEAGQVSYGVLPGAFKRACTTARLLRMVSPGLSGKPAKERTIYKMSLGATWSQQGTSVFEYCVKNECVLLGWGEDIDFSDCPNKSAIEKKLALEAPDIKKPTSQANFVEYFKHEMKTGDLILVSLGNKLFRAIAEVTGEYEFAEDAPFHQMRKVRWLALFEGGRPAEEFYRKEVVMRSLYVLNPTHIEYDRIDALLGAQAKETDVQQHVLIIDEINRANISKVLGELITLIEPDKREGAENAITVTLPYSGDSFSVPSNLHIVGTRNTADRSIALLDTALRRRFDFVEVMPDPGLLRDIGPEGVDLTKVLAALNERIEALYDRDHTIGHAYFMQVRTLDDLEQVFRRRVLPLLQEYFYENWSKVRRVLNDLGPGDFVCKTTHTPVPTDGEDEFSEEVSAVYSVNKKPFPLQAYLRVYAGK